MKFSIITPTLLRMSLETTVQSVKDQMFTSYEHLIEVDFPPTNDFGNTPRRKAYRKAKGDYVIYLDDDNYLTHPQALNDIALALQSCGNPEWALFPILRFGSPFLDPNPGQGRTDSANMVIRRDLAEWPDTREYEADGMLAESLKKYPFCVFDRYKPIITVPKASMGL